MNFDFAVGGTGICFESTRPRESCLSSFQCSFLISGMRMIIARAQKDTCENLIKQKTRTSLATSRVTIVNSLSKRWLEWKAKVLGHFHSLLRREANPICSYATEDFVVDYLSTDLWDT